MDSFFIKVSIIYIVLTHPPGASYMSSIVDIEMVIAVHLEPVKLEQELLNDGLSLEGDDTVLVPLVVALQHHTVNCPLDLAEEVALPALVTDLVHLV